MEIIDVDIINEKGESLSKEKINLPINYNEFIKNKNHALQFFIINQKTIENFNDSDVEVYKDAAWKYQFFRGYTILFTVGINWSLMRLIYANNKIFQLTRRPQFSSTFIRTANKYYFIPQFVGITLDRLIYSNWFMRQTEKIYTKYDFQSDAFSRAYSDILETKHTQVIKRS